MATGKRREERLRVCERGALEGASIDGPLSEFQVAEFIRCGVIPAPPRMPHLPEVEAKIAEIHRNGGKLIVS